jgi:hypothetical protein
MEDSIHLQAGRPIIQDFASTTLARIPRVYGRLIYISSLRDLSSGRYEHAGLAAVYSEDAVQDALELCHEQIFERILEMPLMRQEEDLRECLDHMEGGLEASTDHWLKLESYRVLIPEKSPDYLKELFCSNLRVLLQILRADCSKAHSGA